MKIQALIVDDEPLAREGIRAKLQEDPELELIGECANGRDAVLAIKSGAPDLVFLDVQMPLLDGFGVIESIGYAEMPAVIFVTAYDEFALRAFEAHALDYLLKPINDRRFHAALVRAKKQISRSSTAFVSRQLDGLLSELRTGRERNEHQQRYLERVSVKTKDRIVILDAADIEWIESMDNYVQLNVKGRSHLIRESMKRIESRLDPTTFLRIRRSTLVNIKHIKELQPLFNGEYVIVLLNGAHLQSSRRYRKNLDILLPW